VNFFLLKITGFAFIIVSHIIIYDQMKQLLSLLVLLALFASVTAWGDCPFGIEDDHYPGDCGRYVDSDNDKICDHSQPAPEDRIELAAIQTPTEDSDTEEPIFLPLLEAHKNDESAQANSTEGTQTGEKYPFIWVSAALIAVYTVSWISSKKGKISIVAHRKIWNVLLLIAFLVSGIIGLLLVIRINFGMEIPNYAAMLFWHVEFGIAMAIISVFHFLWHIPYFKAIVSGLKQKK